jgi:DNA-binding NtrC family response regulator
MLSEYSWPGNIRELENLIERLFVISTGDSIEAVLVTQFLGQSTVSTSDYNGMHLEKALESFEKNMLIHALNQAEGVKNRAARILGIKTSTLYYKMDKYGLMK